MINDLCPACNSIQCGCSMNQKFNAVISSACVKASSPTEQIIPSPDWLKGYAAGLEKALKTFHEGRKKQGDLDV